MSVSVGDCTTQPSAREQRRLEREERKRNRNAQETLNQSTKKEKTPNKDDKRKKKTDHSSTNGSASKKQSSASKRTVQTYEKVNIIEKTSPQEVPEKENKSKSANDVEKPTSSRRRLGSKFMDNLSRFEKRVADPAKEKSPFVRSYSTQQPEKQDAAMFRRSYRPPRSAVSVDDPSILVRRSLRKERVIDSIAKLEKGSTGRSLKKQPASPSAEKSTKNVLQEKKSSSRPSSASSSKTSFSDSGSSSSSTRAAKSSRAQQALDRHKERMRKSSHPSSPGKPSSPSSKHSPNETKAKTPKTKQRQVAAEKPPKTPSFDDSAARTVSVSKSPLDGDEALEVTMETEVMTPMKEKLNIVVKEHVKSMEDAEELMSPSPIEKIDEPEYQPGDPRPVSVGDVVAIFSSEGIKTPTTPEPTTPPSVQKSTRIRRKLPEIPPQVEEVSKTQNRKKKKSKKKPEDGSGEPKQLSSDTQEVIIMETSPPFLPLPIPDQSPDFDQISSNQAAVPQLAPMFSFDEVESVERKSKRGSKKSKRKPKHSEVPDEVEQVEGHCDEPMQVSSNNPDQSPMRVVETTGFEQSYSAEDAIRELRRLSEEIHARPSGTCDQPIVTKPKLDDVIAEENKSPDLISDVKSKKKRRHRSKDKTSSIDKQAEERPTSLKIKEILYISDTSETSPKFAPNFSPTNSFAEKSSESKTSPKERKRPKLGSLDLTGAKEFQSSQKSPTKSSHSPTKTPTSPLKAHSPLKSPTKTPTSPTKSVSTPVSPVKATPSPLLTPISPKTPSSPEKPLSPLKTPTSPLKLIDARSPSPEKPLLILDINSSQVKSDKKQEEEEEEEMTGKRIFATRRYKKSWLDDSSDDDNISLLSDADSDDLEIDLKWLGSDSDDEYIPTFSKPNKRTTSGGSGVQRTASKASDMLKMWEKKAAEPINRSASVRSPVKQIVTEIRVGNVRAAWEAQENEREKKLSSSSFTNGHHSPQKISYSPASSPIVRERRSSSDWKPKASDEEAREMVDIFDGKMAGRIHGMKAMFENFAQSSPNRSPVIRRSPRKLPEDTASSDASTEQSPVISRKSSVAEYNSQVSEDSSTEPQPTPEQPRDVFEDFQKVDNVRAMFENQAKKKQITRKHKTSLADMVSDGNDDCDITDVRSVKAMWESMDNHRTNEESKKKKHNKSNIQNKISAKKRGRRSMTQPITTDDVKKAQNMMSSNSNSEVEEEVLNFADRLKFFASWAGSQSKPKVKERIEVRRRTQPVDLIHVNQATELITNTSEVSHTELSESPVKAEPQVELQLHIEPHHPQSDLRPLQSDPRPDIDQSPTASVQKILCKFSISGSSDNESLLSSSSTSFDDSEPGSKKRFLSSSEDDMSVHVADIKTTGSIHDRLKRLQAKNSEEKWKKKPLSEIKTGVGERMNRLKTNDEKWKKSPSSDLSSRVDKLSERIAKIKEDSKTWKSKTGQQNDAAQFTIQAKIAKREGKKVVSILPSPSIKRRVMLPIVPSHVVTEKEAKPMESTSMNQLSFVEKLANKGLEENVLKKTEVFTTEVPTIDIEEFEKFFGQIPENLTNGDDTKYKIEIEELPELKDSKKLSDLGRLKTSVRQNSKRKSSSRNPVKALAARTDIKQSYDSHRSNIVSLEQQRISVQRGHGANFTSAALAGLAARADLSKVNLRSAKNTPMPSNDDLRPFKDVMLLRAKGRRQVQTRLVEPCAKSLSSDDAFLLVTSNQIFGWFGEFCNVIERAKINEIADYIIRKGDLGSKVSGLTTIEEGSDQSRFKEFWNLLGGIGEWDTSTNQGLDEQYEVDAAATIKSYKMIDSKLVPYEDAWGKPPKMGTLGSSDTFVFDFGAEMYIWQGKEVPFSDRRLAVRLARVIWEQGFDYTEHGVCPFHGEELKGERPEFALFARVNENLETSLFQEKFEDWSNIYRETGEDDAIVRETSRGKALEEKKTKSSIVTDMVPYDVTKMKENIAEISPLLVEGYDISQGDGDITDEDGRILEIVTTDVETYIVTDSSVEKFDDSVLHRTNSYVVKWKYSISSTGRWTNSKEKESNKSDSSNGRKRVAYFAWAGVDSALNDKGASALIASNMDTDDGPIINVDESTAPPVFNKCFGGNLAVLDGKRGERRGAYNWRLFQVRGHSKESAALVEVACECKSLRSCSSFVTMMPRDATAIVWHGCRSPNNVREMAESAVNKLSERMPSSLPFRKNPTSLKISICEEGEEIDLFWEAVGIKRRARYECLLDVEMKQITTRAWKFIIQSESFVADELFPVEHDTSFPFVKEQLQEVETPSLILLDCRHGAFLWQNCGEEELSGSSKRRWDVIRRLAMETTLKYCEENKLDEALLVEAGFEPTAFTNAFPTWKSKQKSRFDRSLTQKPRSIRDLLSTLSRVTYSLEELRAPQLPDGVDASHLETYLINSDFEKLFEMSRNDFYELPGWKQTKLRRQKKLF